MNIKITCTDGEYQAGLVYDLPEKKAREMITADKAFEIAEEVIEVTAFGDKQPVYIDGVKEKKVKHANR